MLTEQKIKIQINLVLMQQQLEQLNKRLINNLTVLRNYIFAGF